MLPNEQKLDPRVKRTRGLLLKSFGDLLAEKSFDAITVQDIAERSTINRATFYAHYVDKYARRMNRRIVTIPAYAMEVFVSYEWPGNVRELQLLIERAVILSPGSVLRPPLAELEHAIRQASHSVANTIPVALRSSFEEIEPQHVS